MVAMYLNPEPNAFSTARRLIDKSGWRPAVPQSYMETLKEDPREARAIRPPRHPRWATPKTPNQTLISAFAIRFTVAKLWLFLREHGDHGDYADTSWLLP